MARTPAIISNDDFYKQSEETHDWALREFEVEDASTVKEWKVFLDSNGKVDGVLRYL